MNKNTTIIALIVVAVLIVVGWVGYLQLRPAKELSTVKIQRLSGILLLLVGLFLILSSIYITAFTKILFP